MLCTRSTLTHLGIAALLAGCGERPAVETTATPRPARPAGAEDVAIGESLQARIDAAPAGSALALAPGEHRGPLRLDRRIALWGPPQAVIRSAGDGSTVDVTADGVELLGFTVDGSGGRFDTTDAAVRVRADDVRVEGLTIRRALFGVLVEKAKRVTVRGNVVAGDGGAALGLRGDGIRLWEAHDSLVADNHVHDSRDVVVWYSSNNRISGNTVERSRYGTHFMYSHDNVVEANRYVSNVVAVFVMYSRGVALRRNLLALCGGAAGLGLGLKESGNLAVVDNRFVGNGVGIHSDNSPLNVDDHNRFERNVISGCGTAVSFNGIATRASFERNVFNDNLVQVRVNGGDDATGVAWVGNDFDDYRGYDLDGDGIGDVPYELRSLSTQLIDRFPNLEFFRGTPTLELIDVSSRVVPLFQPKTILIDEAPSVLGAATIAKGGGDAR